jgi:hypothetical protein
MGKPMPTEKANGSDAILCHSTSMDKLFEIWRAGAAEPQVFEGSEHSSCPKGSKVIFVYKCQTGKVRKLSESDEVVIELEGHLVFREGVMRLTKNYEVPEFYIENPIPLKGCRVHIEESDMKRVAQTAESSERPDGQEVWAETEGELQRFLLWILGNAHSLNPLFGRLRLLGLQNKSCMDRE